MQFDSVPICSTVLLVSPSSPTQNAEKEVSPAAQVTAGCVHDADTLVNGPPVTSNPDQFELVEFVGPASRCGCVVVRVAAAAAAASSVMPATSVRIVIRISPSSWPRYSLRA